MRRKSRMVRIGKRKVPLIEKEFAEVSSEDVIDALLKHGAVMIRDPRFEAEKKKAEKRGKKAFKKLGWSK